MAVIEVERARADTPGCERVTHLNNAGAALPPRSVLDRVVEHLEREAVTGAYEAARDTEERTAAVYTSVARLLSCAPEEIALASSASAAWTAAFGAFRFGRGDRILTSRVEYGSNVLPMLQVAREVGVSVEVLPSLATGEVDVDALAGLLDERVRLVAITHVPTESGLVNPAAAIGALTREAGVPYLLDACQSGGQLPLDVDAIGCDLLSATGRKYLRGPRGTGFLYVRGALAERLEPRTIDIWSAEWTGDREYSLAPGARRFEQWERSVALLHGLGAAVDHALGWGLDAIRDRVFALAANLRAMLSALPHVEVRDEGVERCGIVTFTVDGYEPRAVQQDLRARGINVWVSSAAHARFDLGPRGIPELLRASVHYYNTDEELDRLCGALPPPR